MLAVLPVLAVATWLLTNSYVPLTDFANQPTFFSFLLGFSLLILPLVYFYLAGAVGPSRMKRRVVVVWVIVGTSLSFAVGIIFGGFPVSIIASVPQYSCTSYPNSTGFNTIQSCVQTGTSSSFVPASVLIDLWYWGGIVCLLAWDQVSSTSLAWRSVLELKVASALYASALLTPTLSLGIQLGSEIFAWSQRYGLPIFAYEYVPSLCPSYDPTAHWCYMLSPTITVADFLFWSAVVFLGSYSATLLYRRHATRLGTWSRAPSQPN